MHMNEDETMLYSALSLNGAWVMDYSEEKYLSHTVPEFKGSLVEDAVPSYWEDMTERFQKTSFFRNLRINPEYGIQRYPISDTCPDMALPNIMGNFFYRRTFLCEGVEKNASIYFGGVMNAASVWLNGEYLGRHEGYSAPFEVAIPDGLVVDGENTVVLSVSNHRLEGFDDQPIVGITSRAACEWSGGITDSIELRVYNSPLRDVSIIVSEDCKTVKCVVDKIGDARLNWAVFDGDRAVDQRCGDAVDGFEFSTEGLELWSPEHPKLYTLRVECGEAAFEKRFGVRRLTVDGVHFRLNGEPYYLRGACEHCYYPETVQPTHDKAFYLNVIRKLKELGFNYIRFHTYIPTEEYMQAADELGMLMHVESPNNTTLEEWKEIVAFCHRHTSTVIYCCGNELQLYDDFLDHLHRCADEVHEKTDALFSPMSALRGLEYAFVNEPDKLDEVVKTPMEHNPRRFEYADSFCDLYNSYTLAHHSYLSTSCDVEKVDSWSDVYKKPRLSHEICIDGTYTDLSLKERYKGTRIGKIEMFSSIEEHLESKGLLERAPLYFENSCQWQRRVRKYCFEAVRRGENIAGYDFLGPIDTHWHTFGYDVGMMNEFYELKPGETVRNVLRYNSPTVLLTDLGKRANFESGETLSFKILTSCYGVKQLENAVLSVSLTLKDEIIYHKEIDVSGVEGGGISELYSPEMILPSVETPEEMTLEVSLNADNCFAENLWELYLYPKTEPIEDFGDVVVSNGMGEEELITLLEAGRDVVIFGAAPFQSNYLTFKIALAGRTSGNLATVINDHPILEKLPHEGFCSWQFEGLMEDGRAVILESDRVSFDPIVEVVSSHKNAIRQAALFEYAALNGRLIVCGFHFRDSDAAARWLKEGIIKYALSDSFSPKQKIDREGLLSLIHGKVVKSAENTNLAFNPNDKTAIRKKK